MSTEKTAIVVDTNVAVVANYKTEQASQTCVAVCVDRLHRITEDEEYLLLLDDKHLIVEEYLKNLSPSGKPGFGDSFMLWLLRNRGNERHCRIVPVTPHEVRGFEEFPDDPDLVSFDMDDRKFVAVVLARGSGPQVLNASDTDWWHHREPLQRHGVDVVFLCPDLMNR